MEIYYLIASRAGSPDSVWAYSSEIDFRRDLRSYFGSVYDEVRVKSISEAVASMTEPFHSTIFAEWRNDPSPHCFNMGPVLAPKN
jgi:hypothetical protein